MDEFDFIKSIQPSYHKQASLKKGIGDDAAIIKEGYQNIITTVDTMVENIHFSRKTTKPFDIGYRVLAANISDIAAMGGTPTFYLVSIVIPKSWSHDELKKIYQGMENLADVFHMDLLGGDTVSGDQLVVSVTVLGTVADHKERYRSHAMEGDFVFVTGTLGDAAAGLHLLLEDSTQHEGYEYFTKRHQQPMPRVQFINEAASITRIALNDVSDGIANELNEIAEASTVQINIDYERLPKHKAMNHFSSALQEEWLLSGGEDFELVGTVAEKDWEYLQEAANKTNTPLAKIGEVISSNNSPFRVQLYKNGKYQLLEKSGYTHLK
ncbi:thiamine-phosphate kinase [Saliterribacillus persicus]|uniref:Thiamine-monophosphate kinase n=1 Tax=Saliterribacillus persicus TaxID=930114 RepID=A0A368X2F2_9BACI|nr:thiamine-phosphate kinase [Saliterribacillus persicus]RCW62201.1 thiamine-phosphate kinase [Saliterribacillus persicus]